MLNAANIAAVPKSASSSTIAADLPPSSRKTRLRVSLAAAMIAPPGRGRTGEGDHVDVGAGGQHRTDLGIRRAQHVDHAGGDVGVVGDQLAERERDERGVGRALEHHGAARGERGRQLRQRELVGVVVGDDRRDDARGFLLHPAVVLHAAALDVAEVLGHAGRSSADRRSSARSRWAGRAGRPASSAGVAPTSAVVSAASSSRWSTSARWNCSRQWIRRSTSVAQDAGVEGLAGCRDGRLGVGDGALGRVSHDLAGGGVERGERQRRLDELSVDQHSPVGARLRPLRTRLRLPAT